MTSRLPFPVRLPVVAAPMFLVSGPELVMAACTSGVVGAFPAPNSRTIKDLDTSLGTVADGLRDAVRNNPDALIAPYAFNLITHSSSKRLADELKVVAEHKPPIVITALGSPAPVMDVVKGYGGLVIADVVSIRLAKKAVDVGVDGLACISAGAGGHTGHLSPFAFVSAVRQFFDGIVTVGGGISDGQGVAGAIAAGADLVYMGTRFLATAESMAPDAYKQMIVDYGTDDLIVSDAITGTDASWLRPSLVDKGFDPDNLGGPGERSYGHGHGHKKWKDIWAAGQGLGTIKSIGPVRNVIDQLELEYATAADRFMTLSAAQAVRDELRAPLSMERAAR